ncbi:MAG: acyl--CoA ligase [Clostridia bacterium]|nr:acyl--CoA ligase [Clostridia bacterium]
MRYSGFQMLLEDRARQTPEAPALAYAQHGERTVCSFAELRQRVQVRAETLRGEDKRAYGILADGSFDCVIEIFAAVLAGRRTVLLSENAAEETLIEQIREAELDALWGDPDLVEALEPALCDSAEGGEGRILFFTSGTTSRAKAVVLTDASLMNSAYNGGALLPLLKDDTLLCMLPLDHVFGFVCGLLWGLSCGACVALGRGARHFHEDCVFFRPTAISVVPALLGFLLRYRALNPELKLILIGAGGCPEAILTAAKATDARVCFGYGLTETSSGVALSLGEGDPYAMTVCPDDTITIADDGEVLLTAPTCVMQGYWRQPEDTAKVLIDGVLHTGDLGTIDENGKLRLTGRKKEMLVLSDGTKLYLPEYEQALSDALGGEATCILLIDDQPILVLEGEVRPTGAIWEKIRPVLDQRPRNQQIKRIEFYEKPLPRTASGKIMRWAIQREREGL